MEQDKTTSAEILHLINEHLERYERDVKNFKHIKVKFYGKFLGEHPEFTGSLIDEQNVVVHYVKGIHHREDGPALEYPDGRKFWFLDGEELSEQDYKVEVRKLKLKLLEDVTM